MAKMAAEPKTTINHVIAKYLETVKFARSEHTMRAYQNALNVFCKVLIEKRLDPQSTPIEELTEDDVSPFVIFLNSFALATEKLYIQAIKGFYEYVSAEELVEINILRVRNLIRQGARHSHIRLPKLATDDIERLLAFVTDARNLQSAGEAKEKLRPMRDRAFLLTLADTGLRVHEACKLCRGDMDWEGGTIFIGTGEKQTIVRFSTRSMRAIKDYLSLRSSIDSVSDRPLPSLPLFARHDKGAGKKVKPITPTTGRNIVAERVREILGKDSVGMITPHSFRHYFVTTVLKGSGDLKLAQELARHKNIQVTQRYADLSDDELDKSYSEIFNKKDHKQ